MPKLKVCGMKHAANIATIAALEPDYLGFIFYAQSPRLISEVSSELIKYIPYPIKTTGVFVNEDLAVVKALVVKHQMKAVQLHGHEDEQYCLAVKDLGVEIIKSFGIDEHFNFEVLKGYEKAVDFFLFDTQTPNHGGSGKVFDWRLLKGYKLETPYFLSGGIGLSQVAELKKINDPRFYAVDVNSKFEIEPGLKDEKKLKEFRIQIR